ncbi:MAG TPA: MFS transporter [Saprospiraceae bacterium]|nr:MFS transporter [Saprospiraceae bacterium]
MKPIINKEFTFFLITRMLYMSGVKMIPVILGWKLYELTESKLVLGFLGLSEVIPAILLALPAGVKIDRSNKHKLILVCLVGYFLISIFFTIITSDYLEEALSKRWITGLIFFGVFLTGVVRAYGSPALTAFLAQVVKSNELVKAASINSMSWLIAAVVGPVLAGFLLANFGITVTFYGVFIFIVIGILSWTQIASKPVMWNRNNQRTLESVKDGLRFVFSQKALLGAMSLDMFAVLFGGAIALLPVFAKDILRVDAQGYGILVSATYIGNFLSIAYLTAKPLQTAQGKKLFISVASFGFCIILFALSRNFYLSFFALLLSGIFDGVSVIIRGTIFQLFVPDDMRGRVSSVNSIFINSSNELGQFESGMTAA